MLVHVGECMEVWTTAGSHGSDQEQEAATPCAACSLAACHIRHYTALSQDLSHAGPWLCALSVLQGTCKWDSPDLQLYVIALV